MPQVKAHLRYIRIAPRKMRLVADTIRSMNASEASRRLAFLAKRGATPIKKLLDSARANAKHNFHLHDENLYVKEIRVNEGPVLKRFLPRAFGRASLIRKKMSHITIILDETQNKRNLKSEARNSKQAQK